MSSFHTGNVYCEGFLTDVKNIVTHPENWLQWYRSGQKELGTGRAATIINAPFDVPVEVIKQSTGIIRKAGEATQKILQSSGETVGEAPEIAKKIPLILGILAVGVAGYLIFAGKRGTALIPFSTAAR